MSENDNEHRGVKSRHWPHDVLPAIRLPQQIASLTWRLWAGQLLARRPVMHWWAGARSSFNRDPESTATQDEAICKRHAWQSTAGSAFASRRSACCASKRAPRREVAGVVGIKVDVRRGNLTMGPRLTATQSRLPRKTRPFANGMLGSRRRGARWRRGAARVVR